MVIKGSAQRRLGPAGLTAVVLAACVRVAGAQAAGGDEASLPAVEVKGSRPQPTSSTNPTTVITKRDIALSPATNLTELLAAEANMAVQSYYGNDKKSGLDMRGMGDTATSNILIVVDGERLNENDLSGADLSSLSLAQIERIEVLRGGGAVRHGPGAVAGVVRITTSRPRPGPAKVGVGMSVGSFDSRTGQASVEGGADVIAGRLQVAHSNSDGYRANSGYWSNKVAGEVRLTPSLGAGLSLDAFARAALSWDRYGMPGPLPIEVLKGSEAERRRTRFPYDGGKTEDTRYSAGVAVSGESGRLALTFTHRDRHDPHLIGFEPLPDFDLDELIRGQLNEIKSSRDEWQVTQTWEPRFAGLPQSVEVGTGQSEGEYRRSEGGLEDPSLLMTGTARTRMAYLDANLRPVQGVQVHAGVRWDAMRVAQQRYQFGSLDAELERTWGQRSSELGVSWRALPALEPFVSVSRHTRLPNLDELAKASDDLRPQRGVTREVGVRLEPMAGLKVSMSAYDMRITDEIYYGPIEAYGQSLNRNYPWQTHRKGTEADVQWQVLPDRWKLRAQVAYVRPKIAELGTDIPLVARRTFSVGSVLRFAPEWSWTLNYRASSSRNDGNDWANALPKLGFYRVVDTQWSWETKSAAGTTSVMLGIQNLFDEVYTTKAYSQTVYPMPGRTARLSLGWSM